MRACQIVAALRVNSADAPGELFDAYGEELIAYCWQLLRNYDATLIAVRDTMIAAQAHSRRLRDPELLGPWLFALARVECDRGAPAAARAAATTVSPAPGQGAAAVGDAVAAHPAPGGMRDEILACLTDPRQARYRAVVAAWVPPLHPDGFPRVGAAAARWPHVRRPRVPSGFLPVGAAAAAALILLVAGLSLQGGGSAAGAPASASPVAAAQGAPALADSASPEAEPVTSTQDAPAAGFPVPRGHAVVGPTQQALFDVSSQQGQSAPAPDGGQPSPPIPAGMPPLMLLSAPQAGSPTAPWWRQTSLPVPWSPPAAAPTTTTPPAVALADTVSPATTAQGAATAAPAATPGPGRPHPPRARGIARSWRPDWPRRPKTVLSARSCPPPGALAGWRELRRHGSVRDDLAYRYASCTITPRIIFPSSRS